MTIMVNFGRWGGIYALRGFGWRLCLGCVAITILPCDVDAVIWDITRDWRDAPCSGGTGNLTAGERSVQR